jgi:hypothetical protein
MLNFVPKDSISKQLLKSIPRKFVTWMENIDHDQINKGKFGDLEWRVDTDKSWVTVLSRDITVRWSGSHNNPSWIAGSDPAFENIVDNLDFFVSVEKSIYDELEKLQEHYISLNATEIPILKSADK